MMYDSQGNKMYEVSFLKNGIYQSNIVKTKKSPVDIGLWYKENKPDASIIDISIATLDSIKPGKPTIII